MRPHLALCRHSALEDARALALVLETPFTAVEVTFDPASVGESVSAVSTLLDGLTHDIALRYHFPLGPLDISGPSDTVATEALDTITAAISAVANVGGDYLTIHAALPTVSIGTSRFSETVERLSTLVATGREHGVTVALENLKWGATAEPDAFLDLIETSGAAITFDVGHAVSSEPAARGFSAERFIAECGHRIRHAHVYERETDRHHAPTTLDGISAPLDALCDVGCPWWTVELFDDTEVRATRQLLASYLDVRFSQAA